MAVANKTLYGRLLSTTCLVLAAASMPAAAQQVTPVAPAPPGIATPQTAAPNPGPDQPGAPGAEGQTGGGALVSVMQAARPDYDPKGIHVGAFTVNPSLDVTENFSSNVYATTFDQKSDFNTVIAPLVGIQSGWDRDGLGASIGGDITRYTRYSSEDVSNFNGSVNGRKDIVEGVYINASGGYSLEHEPRGSPNAVNGLTPTEYRLSSASLGFVKDNAIVGIHIDFSVNNYEYFDVPTAGGPPVIETDRNRTEYNLDGKFTYEIEREYKAFIRAAGNERAYDHKFDSGGFQRSSTGYEFDAGAALSVSSKIDAEVYVGYLDQSFDDPAFSPAKGLAFGADLLWNVDGLTSVRGSVSRTVEETIVTQASSFVQSSVTLGVEHELLRNVLLGANLNYAHQAYQSFGRVDNIYGVTLLGKYLLNRYLATSLNIGYTKKTSNAIGISQLAEYDQALVAFKLHLQF
jgi:hypothetical protein